jgi:hypothetical protein
MFLTTDISFVVLCTLSSPLLSSLLSSPQSQVPSERLLLSSPLLTLYGRENLSNCAYLDQVCSLHSATYSFPHSCLFC